MKLRTPIVGGALVLAATLAPQQVQASSHREAPFIAKNPKVDGTDFYMFNSYETVASGGTDRSGYVTLLANYQGLQDGYGGPNFFNLDPDALYEIMVDNDGDGVEDITFQFDFDLHLALADAGFSLQVGPAGAQKSVAVPFTAIGGITAASEASSRNVLETYVVNIVKGPRRAGGSLVTVMDGTKPFGKPFDNAGPKTIGDYPTYAKSFIRPFNIPTSICTPTGVAAGSTSRVFVGQRKEGFVVNLGEIFDLVNMKPIQSPSTAAVANLLGARDQGAQFNTLSDKNVTTIALEVPASCLVKSPNTKIGAWTTASVRQARVINPTGTFTTPAKEGGPWVQVSRLGMPLVNEVVIGLPDKNKFNNSEPKNDGANFGTYVTNPTLPELVEILFGPSSGVFAPNRFPRGDLLTVFTLGYPGVNDVAPAATAVPSEMIRLNTAFGVTAPALQNPYGAVTCFDAPTATTDAVLDPTKMGCDPAGFPNGRRPGDDVVDVSIRAAMGALINTTDAPTGQAPLVDGAGVSAANFDTVFPYLQNPLPGAP